MARIESVAKAGYYPTPPRVTELITAAMTKPWANRRAKKHVRLLDPCCGNAEALHAAAQRAAALGMIPTTYGIELSQERARAAQAVLDHVLNCDFFHTTIAHDAFDLIWLNPPYDLETGDRSVRRSETAYLRRCIPYLKKRSGLLIFIIPKTALADCATTLSREFQHLTCLKFPEPEYQSFGQLLITAFRKPEPAPDPDTTMYLQEIAWGAEGPPSLLDPPRHWPFNLPAQGHDPEEILFASQRIDVELALTEAEEKGILASQTVRQRFWPARQLSTRPVLPLRQGHIALMTAAGFLDNQVLHGRDGQDDLIIKGRTYKESIVTKDQPNSRTETEVMRTTIRSLNLRTGERRDIKP